MKLSTMFLLDHTYANLIKYLDDATYFVIRSNIDRGSKMNVGSVTLLRSAPGRSCDMICDRTFESQCALQVESHIIYGQATISLVFVYDCFVFMIVIRQRGLCT